MTLKSFIIILISIYLILPDALGPAVYSVNMRRDYQEQKNNASGE
jgi:hypothetical protein